MIILIDRTNPETRIVLQGEFAEDDADTLLRAFPQLRRANIKETPGQAKLFETEEAKA
jgi:hypothetical protein